MEHRKRNRSVCIRFSDQEYEHMNTLIKETGLSRESFIRSLIGGIVLKPLPKKEMLEIIGQLRRIGNNINQISASANRSGHIDSELFKENYNALQKEITRIKTMLQEPVIIRSDACR